MADRVLGGRYQVLDKVGTGGMATVYRGMDQVLGRTVAIKTMLPQYATDPSFAARFKQEAQAAAALNSPYIVSVYDWGKDGDTYYIIMEYLRGTDLKSGIRKHGALDCRKVAQIGSQIAQALSVAHRHDIIHRDIKPQNIMVQPDGNIKVMDFGIARAKNSHLTTDNSVLGTAHYVSPEQTQGKELGPTTDLYSLGIVMYEAATGRVPFDGDDAITVALKQVNEQPKPPSQINPNVDAALESIILKCMQKNPADRFQTADELYHALRDYLAGRLQAVTTATISPMVTNPIPRANRVQPIGGDTSQLGRTRNPSATGSQRFRQQSATELEAQRKHRRHRNVAIVLVVCALIAALAAAAWALSHPATRSVPNLIGPSKDQAIQQIDATNYFTSGTVKEEYSSTVGEGLVIDQDPDAGNDAPEGTQINLVISKGKEPAQDVTVPDLTNMTPSAAEAALKKLNLVASAGDSVYSDSVETGNVAQQSPAPGTTVKAGDTVTYQLSKGTESVDVPSVVGMSEQNARSALENAGFSVVVSSDYSDKYKEGVVSYQSVTGKATKGSEVDITVSLGAAQVEVPDVVGLDESTATTRLKSAGFSVSSSTVSSSKAAGTVVWQSSTGTASKGASITIGVSSGTSSTTGGGSNSGTGTGTDTGTDSGTGTGTGTGPGTGTSTGTN